MQVKVIIGKNVVFSTYYKTISSKRVFNDDQGREEAKSEAMAIAFSHGCSAPSAQCEIVLNEKLSTDEAVFSFLEKCHTKI